MRILMLAQHINPPLPGGEERFVPDLSYELAARGHHVSIVTLWQKGYPEFEVHRGVRIYRVRGAIQRMGLLFNDSNYRPAPPFPDPGIMSALHHIILEEQPEIVHAHNWLVHSFTPLKRWSKAKFVVSLHDYSLMCVQKRLMRRGVSCTGPGGMKCLACSAHFYGPAKGPLATLANFYWGKRERQAVDLFLPVSQTVVDGNQLDKYKIPYKIIPNFIPDHIDAIDDDDPLLSQLPKGDFLLFVGRILPDKGVKVLLQAYAESNIQMPLVLIGRLAIANLYEQLPQNVFLLGAWPHNAIMAAWKRCAIGLIPSTWRDPCPSVAMEAMAVGKPVIASRSGGLIDIVADGETGLLVPPGDPQALKVALLSLLDNPTLREHMGALAKQRVVNFQAQSVVPRLEQIYQELLDAGSNNAGSQVHIEGVNYHERSV